MNEVTRWLSLAYDANTPNRHGTLNIRSFDYSFTLFHRDIH